MFKAENNEIVEDGDKAGKIVMDSSKSKKSKNEKSEILMCSEFMGEPMFLTSNAKETFNCLR